MKKHSLVVAIIPARGGSKGIPRKNLQPLAGKPLIAYAIEVGLEAPSVDRVIVSTEDEEIARVACSLGAEVPFMRPKMLAQDDTPDLPVFQHLIDWLEKDGFYFDFLVNLRCTTPFKQVCHIESCMAQIFSSHYDSVRSVTQSRGKGHPAWAMRLDEHGCAEPFLSGFDCQRQKLPVAYHLNGVVDVMKVSAIKGGQAPYGARVGLMATEPIYSHDIDTWDDLYIAEAIAPLIKK